MVQSATDASCEDEAKQSEITTANPGTEQNCIGFIAAEAEAGEASQGVKIEELTPGEKAKQVFAPLFVIFDGG